MKNFLAENHGLVRSFVKKMFVSLALFLVLPTSVAVAEPSMGSWGAMALSNAASTVVHGMNVVVPKKDTFVAELTAYTSRAKETDSDPFISADGNYVYDGLIACSREYSFGTKVIVNGRTYTCGDRMAQKNDHARNLSLTKPRFDIWMDDLASAKQWGRRNVEVTVVYN